MYLFPSGSADGPAPVMGHQWRRFLSVHCQASGSPGPEQERQKRWAELFEQLDLNKDGRIDIVELQTGLSGQGLSKGSAEKVRSLQGLWSQITRRFLSPERVFERINPPLIHFYSELINVFFSRDLGRKPPIEEILWSLLSKPST